MGNAFVLEDDLPPKSTVNQWSDREFLERISTVKAMSPCAYITQTSEAQPQMMHNLTDEQGNNWAESYYAICLMSYMDKKFYACLTRNNDQEEDQGGDGLSVPNDILSEYEIMRRKYQHTQIQHSEIFNSTVVPVAQQCFHENIESVKAMRNRSQILQQDIERQQRAYRNFWFMSQSSQNEILPSDTRDQIREKIHRVTNHVCKLQVDLNSIEPPTSDNVVNYGLLNTDLSYCLIANLCAEEVRQCMATPGSTFPKCVKNDPGGNITRCSSRIKRLQQQ